MKKKWQDAGGVPIVLFFWAVALMFTLLAVGLASAHPVTNLRP